jgi:hypothetical protein
LSCRNARPDAPCLVHTSDEVLVRLARGAAQVERAVDAFEQKPGSDRDLLSMVRETKKGP